LKSSRKSSTFYVIRYRHKLCDEERYRCSLAIMKTDGIITIDGVISSISQGCGKLSLNINQYFHRRDSQTNEKAILPYQNLRTLSCLFKNHIAHRLLCKLLEESGGKSSATLIGLPNELKLRIAKFLPIRSLLELQLTCREIYNTLNDQLLWFHFCQRDFDATAINSSPEAKDWPKVYRQLYSQKPRYQTKPSSPIYPIAPVFTYPTIPHRIVFPDPNNAVPPAFHPYPPAIFRPIPPPGLFPSTTVIPFPPGFHPVWLG